MNPDHWELESNLRLSRQAALKEGEVRYLVASSWFKQFRDFLTLQLKRGSSRFAFKPLPDFENMILSDPGPVDNSCILLDDGENLRKDMNLQFETVSGDLWEKLTQHFGVIKGQKPIKRRVIWDIFEKRLEVEVHLLELILALFEDSSVKKKAMFSRADRVRVIVDKALELFSIPKEPGAVTIYVLYEFLSRFDMMEMAKLDQTVQESIIGHGQILLLEVHFADGTRQLDKKMRDGVEEEEEDDDNGENCEENAI